MKPQNAQDPFDTGFSADDDFSRTPDDPWREGSPLLGERDDLAGSDPFADLPPSMPHVQAVDAAAMSAMPAEVMGRNPVADMIAGAEAALGEASVPRIDIHIFCASEASMEVARQACADRRMERATTAIRPGGLATAATYYNGQPTPALVVVESLDDGATLISQLDQLAEVCDPGTKVIVVGAANDIALYRELMRRGVSEYLVPPLQPLQMIRAITTLYSDPAAPFVGRQIAFCGAKGGVGASTLAHNFAYSITERLRAAAVLVDFDLPFGTAGLNFNQDPLQGVADALKEPDRLDPVLMDRMMARCGDRLSLFAAPANLDDDYEHAAEAYEEVAQKIRGATPFVVLDLPHAWSAWKRRMLIASDDLVIVATPDLASLRNAKNVVDLVKKARPNDAEPRLVLNQVGVPGRPEIPAKDFGEALGLTPSLVLPFDAKLFGQAANNGQMLSEVGPKSKLVESLDHFAEQVSRRDPPPAEKPSLIAGLFKRK
jgi:pilus assembly protein CpaE